VNKAIEEMSECFPGEESWGVNSALQLHTWESTVLKFGLFCVPGQLLWKWDRWVRV